MPLLRWAGSKRRLLPDLLRFVPPAIERYVEPFAGSACLFFALQPKRALLGDINHELIQTYQVLAKHPRQMARLVHGWPDNAQSYYRIRDRDPSTLTRIARAARFVYLNRYCFNGVYRVNRQGQFNVPRGVRTGTLPTAAQFVRCSSSLRNADLFAGDFEGCLHKVGAGDFVYLDPPYATRARSTYGEYAYDAFAQTDLPRLQHLLKRLDRSGATFLLSYAYGRTFGLDVGSWYTKRVSVQRHVAGFAKHRHSVYEVLVSNRPLTPKGRSASGNR